MSATYVMPEPQIRVIDGEFRFTGKSMEVKNKGNVLDYLREVGVYNSDTDVYNGSVYFDSDFSIKDRSEEVNEILSIVNRNKLKKDLKKKDHAFLTAKKPGKFNDYQNKKFIAKTDRIIQDLVYQKLSEEIMPVRHLKLQESIELMGSDKDYKSIMNDYWIHNLEVIQEVTKQRMSGYKMSKGNMNIVDMDSELLVPTEAASVRSYWDRDESRPIANAYRPLNRNDIGLAVLKKMTSSEE
ncbi:MAG: hypothetical protein GOV02_01435 [Candidatus Aenigmarchaeota archaeon]|nr:hypothetical protein [Candidatus Aenigmarchaeota archaeon]